MLRGKLDTRQPCTPVNGYQKGFQNKPAPRQISLKQLGLRQLGPRQLGAEQH